MGLGKGTYFLITLKSQKKYKKKAPVWEPFKYIAKTNYSANVITVVPVSK